MYDLERYGMYQIKREIYQPPYEVLEHWRLDMSNGAELDVILSTQEFNDLSKRLWELIAIKNCSVSAAIQILDEGLFCKTTRKVRENVVSSSAIHGGRRVYSLRDVDFEAFIKAYCIAHRLTDDDAEMVSKLMLVTDKFQQAIKTDGISKRDLVSVVSLMKRYPQPISDGAFRGLASTVGVSSKDKAVYMASDVRRVLNRLCGSATNYIAQGQALYVGEISSQKRLTKIQFNKCACYFC